jgi:rRNA maturation RNase YbeY
MPIEFVYNTSFKLTNEAKVSSWLKLVVDSERFVLGEVVYAFFNDDDLRLLNKKHLNHDFYTDVLSFNSSENKTINGNIAISIDRVKDNVLKYNSNFEEEILRVMVHGLLHFMGFNDNTKESTTFMTQAEDDKIKMFHVEQ